MLNVVGNVRFHEIRTCMVITLTGYLGNAFLLCDGTAPVKNRVQFACKLDDLAIDKRPAIEQRMPTVEQSLASV